jgi:hypothetical protein
MTTPTNQSLRSPYLRQQRDFPRNDITQLSRQIDEAYVDIASKVNERTVSSFGLSNQVITGEQWYLQGVKKQQTLRQVYTFGAIASGATLDIPHNIPASDISQFTRIWGTIIDSTGNYRPLPYSSVAAGANVELFINTNAVPPSIQIQVGASFPPIKQGLVVLEWLTVPDVNI